MPSIYLLFSDIVLDGTPLFGAPGELDLIASASRSLRLFLMIKKIIPPAIQASATSPIVNPTAAPVPSFEPPPPPSSSLDFLLVSIGAACVGMTVIICSSPDSVTVDAKASVSLASELVLVDDGGLVVDGEVVEEVLDYR